MNGILPLWKPQGMTSHDCVMKIRKLFHVKKVGHTGTLDPEVEGVLPVCVGQATKIVPFLTDTKKTYIAELKLGIATETEDSYGAIIQEQKVANFPSQQSIENVLQLFRGKIIQIPPMYSAVKVNGRRLYEYARVNEYVKRPERQVEIYQLELTGYSNRNGSISVRVVCSKGTYIRTLCVDIGRSFGYPAHMSELKRIETGTIKQKDTVTFSDIEEALESNSHDQLLLPIACGLSHLEHLYVDENTRMRVLNGQKLSKPESVPENEPFAIMVQNRVLAIYQIHPEKPDLIKPVRVFNE
ncbi:tRNA pseudouridine(55) synthase TruB [Virgibacillus doumboii]|uniref:tRNA pseudouridine(55) synthase TruB n=1 Tax=Virgibacillus doumboii TaxID=2697503 RepID=UPI0013DF293F|nr:tRNA pseudouridine(55) synthase TruB [Virgibacillus doumboii]